MSISKLFLSSSKSAIVYYFLCVVCQIHVSDPSVVRALENGLASVPPMGWNSWNGFHCNVSQDLIVSTANQIKSLGLDKLGYRYVNIDDCWMDKTRNANGELVGHPKRFDKGMKWMGDYLHSLDLLFGIYSSAGTKTCAGFPASLGYESIDAQTFANWGVDYLKYDNCYNNNLPSIDRYATMRNALNATGRPILFSLCQWGTESSWQWAASMGNTWRTTGDIEPDWKSVEGCFWQSQKHFEQSRNGAWLDPDMLEVGNGDLTLEENKSHFSLWVLAKAPLLLGNDLFKMSPEIFSIISNKFLIDIHQDPNMVQATCYYGCERKNWCPPTVDGLHVRDTADILNPKGTCTATSHDEEQEDYSVFATTKRHSNLFSSPNNIVAVMLIINWHDKLPLSAKTLNVVQLLGIAPFPSQSVLVRDLWTGQPVSGTGDDGNNIYFSFDDLKNVPFPSLKPHDCAVYSFSIISNPTVVSQETQS